MLEELQEKISHEKDSAVGLVSFLQIVDCSRLFRYLRLHLPMVKFIDSFVDNLKGKTKFALPSCLTSR